MTHPGACGCRVARSTRPRKKRHAVDLTAEQHLLAQLAERSEHGAERQLGAPASIHQARADHGRLWMPIELGDQACRSRRRARWCRCSTAEARCRCSRGSPRLFAPRKSEIRCRLDDRHAGPSPRGGRAAVARLIVDDDDLVGDRGARRVERLEAPLEIGSRVVADDDDRKIGHLVASTTDVR